MDTSKEVRKKIEISDLEQLELMTKDLLQFLQKSFVLKPMQTNNWPWKYLWQKDKLSYEFIFSQMGSFTVRLSPEHSVSKQSLF